MRPITVRSAVQARVGPFCLSRHCFPLPCPVSFALNQISHSICGLMAMTSVSHAEGRQFDPGQMYFPQTSCSSSFFAALLRVSAAASSIVYTRRLARVELGAGETRWPRVARVRISQMSLFFRLPMSHLLRRFCTTSGIKSIVHKTSCPSGGEAAPKIAVASGRVGSIPQTSLSFSRQLLISFADFALQAARVVEGGLRKQ